MLGALFDFPEDTMAIGRLDEDTEGLLLLTTDGKISHKINNHKAEKEYFVQLDGIIDQEAIVKLEKGVLIGIKGDKYHTNPCKVQQIPPLFDLPIEYRKVRDHSHGTTSWISITVTEGKYRQVRKMTAVIGFPTLRLIRVRIGKILLDMQPGKVVEVSDLDS